MKATDISNFAIAKAHCDWIKQQATELKKLIDYESIPMLNMNNVRALSAISTMEASLRELKEFIESQGT